MKGQLWQKLPTKKQFYLSELWFIYFFVYIYQITICSGKMNPLLPQGSKPIIVIPFPLPVINLDTCRRHGLGQ